MAALSCLFAVFFARTGRSQPGKWNRKEIAQFIQQGGFFAKEPTFKPSAKSSEINDPKWLTLEIRSSLSKNNVQIAWLDCNHVYPDSLDPLKDMAQGMLLDARVDKSDSLVQTIADSIDALCVQADPAPLKLECPNLLDGLKLFLAKRLHGVVFEPGVGFFDDHLQPLLTFPKKTQLFGSLGTLVFGNPKAQFDAMALSADGKTIGTTGEPGNRASIWNAETGELQRVLAGHKKPTRSIAFSPDGTTVATGSEDKSVILWDTAKGSIKKILLGHGGIVGAVAFSPDGLLLASGGYDGTTILWELPEGKKRTPISPHGRSVMGLIEGEKWYSSRSETASVCSVAFSPDGRFLASGGTDGTVWIVAVDSGELVRSLEGYGESAWPVAYSPDGTLIAAGSYDRKVRIWNVTNGKLKATLGDHGNYVFAVAFSPDGTKVGTGSTDTLVRIWDVAKRKRLCTFFGHRSAVEAVAFFPDGMCIASTSNDGTVRVWRLQK